MRARVRVVDGVGSYSAQAASSSLGTRTFCRGGSGGGVARGSVVWGRAGGRREREKGSLCGWRWVTPIAERAPVRVNFPWCRADCLVRGVYLHVELVALHREEAVRVQPRVREPPPHRAPAFDIEEVRRAGRRARPGLVVAPQQLRVVALRVGQPAAAVRIVVVHRVRGRAARAAAAAAAAAARRNVPSAARRRCIGVLFVDAILLARRQLEDEDEVPPAHTPRTREARKGGGGAAGAASVTTRERI